MYLGYISDFNMDNDFVCYTIESLKLDMPPPLEINLETKQRFYKGSINFQFCILLTHTNTETHTNIHHLYMCRHILATFHGISNEILQN